MNISVRDGLWLAVVVVLAVGWLLTAQQKALLEARYQALVRLHNEGNTAVWEP
jgi:hypothetical protein